MFIGVTIMGLVDLWLVAPVIKAGGSAQTDGMRLEQPEPLMSGRMTRSAVEPGSSFRDLDFDAPAGSPNMTATGVLQSYSSKQPRHPLVRTPRAGGPRGLGDLLVVAQLTNRHRPTRHRLRLM